MVGLGFRVFDPDPDVRRWAQAALFAARIVSTDPTVRAANLRHGGTWFVGVDALPNAADGSIDGVPLAGNWRNHVSAPSRWHPAQLSVVYPGYPLQDAGETDANHRYRINRYAAHVDGLLPQGPDRRRFLKEPHAFILGLPLNASTAAPLVVWPDSHRIMGQAFAGLRKAADPTQEDITEVYQNARRQVFEEIEPQSVVAGPGQVILLHRHLLHGVHPWVECAQSPQEGRIIAYFRPQFTAIEWLSAE
jgi:hypothetical protein